MTPYAFIVLVLVSAGWDRPDWREYRCRDTRELVIQTACRETWSADGCKITALDCRDRYTGGRATRVQVDHLYPAVIGWARGTWLLEDGTACTVPRRCPSFLEFFNDRDNLLPASPRANASKGARMPGEWCPALPVDRRYLARRFRAVIREWKLPITADELAAIRRWERGEC